MGLMLPYLSISSAEGLNANGLNTHQSQESKRKKWAVQELNPPEANYEFAA